MPTTHLNRSRGRELELRLRSRNRRPCRPPGPEAIMTGDHSIVVLERLDDDTAALRLAGEPDPARAREVLARFGDHRPGGEDSHVAVTLKRGASEIAPVVRALDDAGLQVAALELVQPSLDDVFLEKTGQRLEGDEEPVEASAVATA